MGKENILRFHEYNLRNLSNKLQKHLFFSFYQCPEFLDLEKDKLKSKESLSSGMHLNTASEDNLTSLLQQDSDPSLELHSPQRKTCLPPTRRPSLTDSSPSTAGIPGLHRHVSDPGLPGK